MMAKAKREAILTTEEQLQQALVPDWEWTYRIPKNWCWTRIGCVTEIIGGGTPPSSVMEYYLNGDIPWISPADLSGYSEVYISRGSKNITKLGLEMSSARMVPSNTVCLSSRAPIGYVAIAQNPLCTNQGFKSFLPSSCYLPKYLYWYLKGNKELLESYASGTTFLELSGSKAAKVEFPLPPLAEQQRIVDRIESLFAKLDEAKEKVQAVVDGFETRKVAILHKAFTGELTTKWRKENGMAIEKWENVTFDTVANAIDPQPSHRTPPEHENGIPYIGIAECDYKTLSIDFDSARKVSRAVLEEHLNRYHLRAGDFIIGKIGTVGKPFKIPIKQNYTLSANIVLIQPITKKIYPEFLFYQFQTSMIEKQFQAGVKATTQAAFGIRKVRNMIIIRPSMSEQQEIVHILNMLIEKEQRAKDAAETVLEQIDLIKKSILARAFRGELSTNDSNDENAKVLLKNILSSGPNEKTETPRKKQVTIPDDILQETSDGWEKEIIKIYFKRNVKRLPFADIMAVSPKKFEILESLRKLEQKDILEKQHDGTYILVR